MNKKIFVEHLPKWNYGGARIGKTNWHESIGEFIGFEYGDIVGKLKIINYDGKYLYVKYLQNPPFKISTGGIMNCSLGKLLNKITNEFKIEIGTVFKDDKRDITITDRKYEKDKKGEIRKYYKYRCNICGFDCGKHYHVIKKEFKDESWILESNIFKQGCSCCCHNPQVVVKGINDISTTAPHIAKLFVNKEDLLKTTCGTSSKRLLRCPDCQTEKYVCISNLTSLNRPFPCEKCSDNISIPEKFLFSLLQTLNEKYNFYYKTQLTKYDFEWCGKYKYDFYFKLNNEQYIVETHGKQHYEETNIGKGKGRSYEEEVENDRLKKELALSNGIKEENYIIIDCRESEMDWIKKNILKSKLNNLFDLKDINWLELYSKIQSSLMIQSCKLKRDNQDLTCNDISNILNIGLQMVRGYLKRGNYLGFCHYDGKEEMRKHHSKKVNVYKNKKLIYNFSSIVETYRKSKDILGEPIGISVIGDCCNGKRDSYKDYKFKFA